MDLNKTYSNPKLELRRKQILQTRKADAVLRRRKERRADPRVQILYAFGEGGMSGPLAEQLRHYVGTRKRPLTASHRDALRRLLLRVEAETRLLENDWENTLALVRLARHWAHWVRQPEAWKAHSYNHNRIVASLARHLLARFHVPSFMDAAWQADDAVAQSHQSWFIHIGDGRNIRKASGLPVPLTKLMAHHVLFAPDGCSIPQAIRWGQLRGMGVGERHAHAVLGSRLAAFTDATQETFWVTAFNFLALNPMLDPNQVGPIIDYLHNQKFVPAGPVNVGGTFVQQGPPQPGLSMKGRTAGALVAQVDQWHRQLRRTRGAGVDLAWAPCGIGGYDRVEGEPGNQRRFVITELLSAAELRAEGTAMRHCVATYANSCGMGRTAIFSLKVDYAHGQQERMVTIEVDVKNRQITQVRGKYNAASTQFDQRVLNAWATTARLGFSRFALTRWA